MERHGPQWMVVAALLATLAGGAPAHGAVTNIGHALVRAAPRSATAARAHAPRHHRFRAHHTRLASLSSRRTVAASAVPRPAPVPSRPTRHHRATVPALVRHGQTPRSLRGGAQTALPTPDRGALLSLEVRDLGLSRSLVPMSETDPVRGGRGPPRAGPERTLPARPRPAPAGSETDAHLPASASVSPLTTLPLTTLPRLSLSPATPPPSAGNPISVAPVPVPSNPRPALGRLHASRPEGTAARFSMPS